MSSSPAPSAFVRAAPAIFVLLWSTGYVGARFGLPYAEPMTFTSIRFGIVLALLVVIAVARRARLPRPATMWGHLAISGMLIHSCFIGGVFIAIDGGVNIGIASLIAGAQPLLTALLLAPVLGESLTRRQWTGFIAGFVGLALVVVKSFDLGTLPPIGFVACLVALFGITLGALYQKRFVHGVDLLAGSAVQFAAALVPCTLWAVAFETRVVAWNGTFILALLWLCLALSIGAISILLFLIREGAAARVSSLFYLVPPATALQGYWFFGERLSPLQLGGILITALGVAMINTGNRVAEPRGGSVERETS